MKEIWKDIPNFEGFYQASNLGKIRSVDRYVINKNGAKVFHKGRMLRTVVKNANREYVQLSKHSKYYTFLVHRLIGMTFIPNPDNLPQINHKDENPLNNHVENLEWCTHEYNQNYGTRTIRQAQKIMKPVDVYTLDKNYLMSFNSIKEAAETLDCDESCIAKVCKNKNKYHKEYIFTYANQQPS